MDPNTQDMQNIQKFTADWGIRHVTSSPHYPKSNGFIERHVRHIKSIAKKTLKQGGDIQVALLQVKATPIDSKLPSPAELIFGRPVTTLLPSRGDIGKEEHRLHLEQRTADMKAHHDRSSGRDLPPLSPGQHVSVLNKERGTWYPATVVHKCDELRSYIVQTPNGNKIRRGRSHLREIHHPHALRSARTRFTEPQPQNETHAAGTSSNQTVLGHYTERNGIPQILAASPKIDVNKKIMTVMSLY